MFLTSLGLRELKLASIIWEKVETAHKFPGNQFDSHQSCMQEKLKLPKVSSVGLILEKYSCLSRMKFCFVSRKRWISEVVKEDGHRDPYKIDSWFPLKCS